MIRPDWSRRDFLGTLAASGAALAWPAGIGLPGRWSTAGSAFKVGFIAGPARPTVRDSAELGARFGAGEVARLAELLDKTFELVIADPGAGLEQEARRLVEREGVLALVGGLDADGCTGLSRLAHQFGVPFFNVGCPGDRLRGEDCRRTTFSIQASAAMYADALGTWLVAERDLGRWYFVTASDPSQPSVHARLSGAIGRLGGVEVGSRRISGSPEVGELLGDVQRSGAEVLFLDLPERQRAPFLRAYRERDPPFELAGPPIASSWLWSLDPELRVGIWPTLWHHKLFKYGAEQLNGRFASQFQRPLEAYGWASWMALKILGDAVLRGGSTEADELIRFLESDRGQFDGHKGKRLSFRAWNHQLRQPIYLVRGAPGGGGDSWDVFDSVAELPLGEPGPELTSAEFLDELGERREEGRCRFAT